MNQHIERLKKIGVYEEWKANVSTEAIKDLRNCQNWEVFIAYSFDWLLSPEGYRFWKIVQKGKFPTWTLHGLMILFYRMISNEELLMFLAFIPILYILLKTISGL